MKIQKKEDIKWKKKSAPWKQVKPLKNGVQKISYIPKDMKKSLQRSTIGYDEREEEAEKKETQSSSFSMDTDWRELFNQQEKVSKKVQTSHQRMDEQKFLEFYMEQHKNLPELVEPKKNSESVRFNFDRNVPKSGTQKNPYGWGSSSSRVSKKMPWETRQTTRQRGTNAKIKSDWRTSSNHVFMAGKDQPKFSTQGLHPAAQETSKQVTQKAVTHGATKATGEVAVKTLGNVSAQAAGGAATGGISVAASAAISVVMGTVKKGKEMVVSNLKRSKELEEQMKKEKSSSGGSFALVGFGVGILICFIMIFSMMLTILFQQQQNPAENIVEVAKAELEAWESNVGGRKYKEWYGVNGNWCAMFVSWCSDQCGYVDEEIMPNSAAVRVMANWYRNKNLFKSKSSGYEPKAGDIIFFQEGMSHVGIVIDYDSETKIITTIEGNTGNSNTNPYHLGSRVKECRYPLTYRHITGYGLPEYPIEDLLGEIEEASIPKRYLDVA